MIFYTDGSCRGNGKANNSGGFGVVILNNDGSFFDAYSETEENTTNNRQEMKAIYYVLINYGLSEFEIPVVYSDSNYCVQTFNNWMHSWARKGWIKSDKKTPENLDIIQNYFNALNKGYKIDLRKVAGHSGIKWNEVADKLATGELTPAQVRNLYGNKGDLNG